MTPALTVKNLCLSSHDKPSLNNINLAIFPGLAIIFTVLGLNLMGDGLRDLFDPRLQRERQE